MLLRKFLVGMICLASILNACDSLVGNEPYFQDTIEKCKLSGLGEDRVMAVLDAGINDAGEHYEKEKML